MDARSESQCGARLVLEATFSDRRCLLGRMKISLLILIVWSALGNNSVAQTNATAFIQHLIDQSNRTASANFTAACINLVRDVSDRRLTIYSVVGDVPGGVLDIGGFKVEIIYHRDLEKTYPKTAGSYIQHYNGCLLDFAAAQFSDGKKSLGLDLIKLLADANPTLSWSSARITPLNIKKILEGLKSDNGGLDDLLAEAKRDWLWRAEHYKR
jgi:hypothetical protein